MWRKWIGITVAVSLTLIPISAQAEDWRQVGRVGNRAVLLDRDSIKRNPEDWNVWVAMCRYLISLGSGSQGGPEVQASYPFAVGAHCPQRLVAIYDGTNVSWLQPRHGTIGGHIYNYLCVAN